jgi:hypothetical protein
MSISKFPQSQAALATAFQTIANHVGVNQAALDKLSDLSGIVSGEHIAYLGKSLSVACPASTALSAFISGALKTANGAVTPAAGVVFTLTTTQDTSDTKFDTAKGSVPAVGDVFAMTSGAAIGYLGTTAAALATALQPYTYRGSQLNKA